MKTTLAILAILIVLLACLIPAHAQSSVSNMVTYAASGGASTNNGTPVYIGSAYLAVSPSFLVSDGGTTATNALTVYVQYGLDTNYFATVATYTKTATNATDGLVSPGAVTIRLYAQTKVITTNSVSVGTKAIYPAQ